MTYEASRDAAQMLRLDTATTKFIQRWKEQPPCIQRRTLFMFPGGMGSELFRARKPYKDSVGGVQMFKFDKVWATICTFLGDALKLEMVRQPDGSFRDKDNHIIIAYGSCELLGIDPYDGFWKWADKNNIDVFTFGWDWRRPSGEAADFFATKFLPVFQARVVAECGVDPLTQYALVGHSFGGMVVNQLMRKVLPGTCYRAVTVGGLFHGYSGQIHRYFTGDSHFELLDTMDVIRTLSSFNGCYELPFLDVQNYVAAETALAADDYPLLSYPSVDAVVPSTLADPFHPTAHRYPPHAETGFDTTALATADHELDLLMSSLPPDRQPIFTAIRGVISDHSANPLNSTPSGIRWRTLPSGPYNPSQNPIVDGPWVPGDGTLPAWSTYLIGASTRVVKAPDIDHAYLLEHPEVQAVLGQLL